MQQLVVWTLDTNRYALPFSVVDRVVRAVEVTPLPDAPEIISGIINVQGRIIPVVNMRARFGLPSCDIALTDQIVLAQTSRRRLAFFVDAVQGMVDYPESAIAGADDLISGMGCVAGIIKFEDGLVLIQDLERCLSADQEQCLDTALHNAG